MYKQHLSYEELNWYLEASSDTETNMKKMEDMMEHMMECEICQKRLQNMLMISSVCEPQNLGDSLFMLSQEEEIRRELVALRLMMEVKEERMRQVALRLREGILLQRMILKEDLVSRNMVMRGEEQKSMSLNEQIEATQEGGILKVVVACEENRQVTAILMGQREGQEYLMTAEGNWMPEKKVSVAEFKIGELQESYEIYVDIVDSAIIEMQDNIR